MGMVYKWKSFANINVDAQVAGDRIAELEQKNGSITPKLLVDDARPAQSPLHNAFEWNNDLAAEKFREDQARYMLRQITVICEERNIDEPVRAFVNVVNEDSEERVYIPIISAMENKASRQFILSSALKELKDWRNRYKELSELAKVIDVIDDCVNCAV